MDEIAPPLELTDGSDHRHARAQASVRQERGPRVGRQEDLAVKEGTMRNAVMLVGWFTVVVMYALVAANILAGMIGKAVRDNEGRQT
jgi:hypothetical protein